MEFLRENKTTIAGVLFILALNVIPGLFGYGPMKDIKVNNRMHLTDANSVIDAIGNMTKDKELLQQCKSNLNVDIINAKAQQLDMAPYAVGGVALMECTLAGGNKEEIDVVSVEWQKAVLHMTDEEAEYLSSMLEQKAMEIMPPKKKKLTPREEALAFCKKDMPMEIGFCMAKSGFEQY